MRILVVEDEAAIADFLKRGLRGEGFEVAVAADGEAGERAALDPEVELVVLDRMLPGRSGDEVLAALRRRRPALPVIMLTARAEVAERIEGLESGATDYVVKPFAFDELVARIRVRLREQDGGGESSVELGDLRLDLLRREVSRDGASERLPEREAALLAHLMRHADRVCSRQELLAAVWGYDHDPGTNVVRVYVGYLRQKLGRLGAAGRLETVRGVGYRLRGEA